MTHNQSFNAQVGAEAHDVERVDALLEEQEQLFAQLDALGEQQSFLVDADDAEALLLLLAERQRLIDSIAANNASLTPYRARWAAFLGALAEPERERLRRRVDVVAELAGRVAIRDESHRATLESRRAQVASELGQIGRARGAVAAYGQGARSSPRFQDREA
jgi:hypothetical protein